MNFYAPACAIDSRMTQGSNRMLTDDLRNHGGLLCYSICVQLALASHHCRRRFAHGRRPMHLRSIPECRRFKQGWRCRTRRECREQCHSV